jgi:hypothetical protein
VNLLASAGTGLTGPGFVGLEFVGLRFCISISVQCFSQ